MFQFRVLFKFDGLLAVRAYGNDDDRHFEFFLEIFDIGLEFSRELAFALDFGHIGFPAFDFGVNRLDAFIYAEREIAGGNSVYDIAVAGFDGVEAVEDVALHHDELGDTVEHNGVAHSNEVNPAAATLATCYGAILMADGADSSAGFVEKLCGEWAGSDAGAICLEDAVNVADSVWSYAKTGASSGANGVA